MQLHSSHEPTEAHRVLNDLRRIVQFVREGSRAAEEQVGLSGAQLFVLQTLSDGKTRSVNEVADRTFTHQSTVSVVVKRLVDRGLIRRTVSSEDARRIALSITPRGRLLLARSPGAAQARLLRGLMALPDKSRAELARSLSRWVRAIAIADQMPSMLLEDPQRRARGIRSTQQRTTRSIAQRGTRVQKRQR